MFQNLPSTTAEAVCLIRAYEHAKRAGARVIDDPYAHWFLGPVLRTALSYEGVLPNLGPYPDWATDGIVGFVAARHRYIDDALRRASRRIGQVVLLGAGYDMRAYRFARELRRCTVFEVDHPATACASWQMPRSCAGATSTYKRTCTRPTTSCMRSSTVNRWRGGGPPRGRRDGATAPRVRARPA